MANIYPIIEFTVDLTVQDSLAASQPYSQTDYFKYTRSTFIPVYIDGDNIAKTQGQKFTLFGKKALYLKKLIADGTVANVYISSEQNSDLMFIFTGSGTETFSGSANNLALTPNGTYLSGTYLTIMGAGFTGTTSVQFGSVSAPWFNLVSDNLITTTSLPVNTEQTINLKLNSNTIAPFTFTSKTITGTFTDKSHLTGAQPQAICFGPDGNFWTTDNNQALIWKVTPSGTATSYTLTGASTKQGICVGPDQNIWTIDGAQAKVWKVTTSGTATSYNLAGANLIAGICVGPDSNIWVADFNNKVWKITTSGSTTSYSTGAAQPLGICTGPDGNLWVSCYNARTLKVTTSGTVTSYAGGSRPSNICSGADGNLWASDIDHAVLKITTSGVITSYNLTNNPSNVAATADGNIWCIAAGHIFKVTTSGSVTTYTNGEFNYAACTGADGNLWVADGRSFSGGYGIVWQAT